MVKLQLRSKSGAGDQIDNNHHHAQLAIVEWAIRKRLWGTTIKGNSAHYEISTYISVMMRDNPSINLTEF